MLREIVISAMSEQLKNDLGIDFRVAKTVPVKLEDPSFAQGTKSKDPVRVGALQEGIPVNDGDPGDARKFLGDAQDDELKTKIESINEDDAQNVAILDFLTLNGDRHAENMMLESPGDAPGQTKLRPIDAGQSLPTKEGFRRGSQSMLSVSKYDPTDPKFEPGDNMIMQLPVALKKFSPTQQNAIAQLDPDKVAADMKKQYLESTKGFPELQGGINDESFELVAKSGHFLKAAAPELTMREIALVYACGFDDIMNAGDANAIQKAVRDTVALAKEYAQLGGDDGMRAIGLNVGNPPLKLENRVAILKSKRDVPNSDPMVLQFNAMVAEIQDIDTVYMAGSNNQDKQEAIRLKNLVITQHDQITANVSNGVLDLIVWKFGGGDTALQNSLVGSNAAYVRFAAAPLQQKSNSLFLNPLKEFMRLGGFPKLRTLVDDNTFRDAENNLHMHALTTLLQNAIDNA